ncbi:MAG: PAS domain S-box protein [Nitrospirae bacterium]|nr:PAS domain S-box protein [Nitrospirota bacterium]
MPALKWNSWCPVKVRTTLTIQTIIPLIVICLLFLITVRFVILPAMKAGGEQSNDITTVLSVHSDIDSLVSSGNSYVVHGTIEEKEKFYDIYIRLIVKISKFKTDIMSGQSGGHTKSGLKIGLLDSLLTLVTRLKLKADVMFNNYESTGILNNRDYAEYEKLHNNLDDNHHRLLQLEEANIGMFYNDSKAIFDKYLYVTEVFFVFSVIYSAIVWLYATRTIYRPILELKRLTGLMVEGSLDQPVNIKSNDEIGELSIFIDDLRKTVKKTLSDKEMEIAARDKANAQLTTLLNSVPDLIYIKDIYRQYVLINNAFKEFLGLDEDEIIGKTDEKFFPGALSEKIKENEDELLTSHKSVKVEHKFTSSSGDLYLDTIKTPIFSETGGILGFVAVSRDITNRKLTERILQEINGQLHMEIQRREQFGEKILSSLKEKEILLKEVHHRVKNNLQIISSLLYLQSINLKNVDPQEVLSVSRNRIRSMALVHEKLYKSGNFATIDFGQYIRELASDIMYSYGVQEDKITLNMKCDNILLDVETSIPCGLIANELVSNAVKYAFPGNATGTICISLNETASGALHLVIGDNGVGIPKGPGNKDIFNSDSLGLKLVNNLVKQIKGTLEFSGDGGTEFKITFQKRP